MQHFLKEENLGLVYLRNITRYKPTYFFISDKIADVHLLDSSSDSMFLVPLYLFQDNSKNKGLFDDRQGLNKIPNFTLEFQKFISTKYSFQPTPEEILGYIYAVFYSPTYREKYLEFLKIDFTRVPFVDVDNGKLFKELSNLGTELIEHHLMKKSYPKNQVTFPVDRTNGLHPENWAK